MMIIVEESLQVERDAAPHPPFFFFFFERSGQAEEPQTSPEVEQADWLCLQLRGILVQTVD